MSTAPVKSQHPQQQQQHQQQRQQQQQQQQQHQQQQPLHNFSLPSFLKWPSSHNSSRLRREPHPPRPTTHVSAPAVAASPRRNNNDDSGNGNGPLEGDANPKKEEFDGDGFGLAAEGEDARKPWNLRPRKAVAMAPTVLRNGEQEGGVANRLRRNGEGGEEKEEEKEGKKKRRLWIALTKEEIEEDVFIMTGCRPSRRPRKRSKTEQKQLDCVFPGLWLVGMTADAYRVADAPLKR